MSNSNIKSDYLIQKFLSNPKIFNKYFKNSYITSKKIIKNKSFNFSYKKLIYNNLKKHNTSIKQFNSYIINSIVFDLKSHIVALFKEYLLYDETAEFLKRFYKKYESKNRIPQITDYYVKYTLIPPLYFAHEGRIIIILKKFLKRKKKYLEYIEEHENTILNQKNKKFNFNFEPIITKSLIESNNNSIKNSTLISYINKSNSKMTLELTEFDDNKNNNNSKSFSQLINNSSSILNKNTPIKNLKTKNIIKNNAQTYNEEKCFLNNNNLNKRTKPKIEKLKVIEIDKINEEKKINNNINIYSHNNQINKDLMNIKKIFFNNTSNSSKLNKRKNYIEFTDNKRKIIENDDLFEYKLKKLKNKLNTQNILAYTTTNSSIKNINNNNTNTLKSINTYNLSNKDIKQNNHNLIIKNIFTNKTLSSKNSTKKLKRIYSSNFKKIKNNIYYNNINSHRNLIKNKNDINYITNSQSKDKNVINKDLYYNTSILHTIQNKKQLKKINLNLNVNFNVNINYLKEKICKSNGNSKSKKRLMLKEESFKNNLKEKIDKNDKKYPKIIYDSKINSNDNNKIDMIYYQISESQNNKDFKNNNHKKENSNRIYLYKKIRNNNY